jgi:hypothetical protein
VPDSDPWPGVRRDLEDTEGRTYFAQNVRYWTTGELQRRHGLTKFAAVSGVAVQRYFAPGTGFAAVFATSTGTIETITV